MRKLFFGLTILFASISLSQEAKSLTLDECIAVALDNNIDVKRARNGEIIARANRFQAMMNFLPTLSARINYDFFFGTFFDTNAARQVSETTNSSNPNVSTSAVLWNGFANQYNLKQRMHEQKAASAGVDDANLNVQANIMTFYLNAVLSIENLRIAEERVDLLEKQLDREEKRLTVGVGNLNDVYNFRSQVANEKLNLVTARNTVASSKLALIQAMQLDPQDNYDIMPIDVVENDLLIDLDPFDQVLSESLGYSPTIMQAESNRKVAKYSMKGASAGRFPTISAFGRIGSNFSSNGAFDPETGNFIDNASFADQLRFNEFEYLDFSLSIPIFNRFQASRDVQVAKVGVLNADLDYQQAQNTITNIVQQAYLDMVNAQTTYQSASENLDAQQSTFDFIKKRFETGNTDFYSYQESLNNKNRAESQLVNAKYTIVLRKRILDLYRGKSS